MRILNLKNRIKKIDFEAHRKLVYHNIYIDIIVATPTIVSNKQRSTKNYVTESDMYIY